MRVEYVQIEQYIFMNMRCAVFVEANYLSVSSMLQGYKYGVQTHIYIYIYTNVAVTKIFVAKHTSKQMKYLLNLLREEKSCVSLASY